MKDKDHCTCYLKLYFSDTVIIFEKRYQHNVAEPRVGAVEAAVDSLLPRIQITNIFGKTQFQKKSARNGSASFLGGL